jgi:hypothetical protein
VVDEGVRGARAAVLAATLLGVAACGEAAPPVQTASVARPLEAPARPYPEGVDAWGPYHSPRFRLTIPLPHPRAWKIDDASRPELLAVDATTRSKLVVLSEDEPDLVNHQKCEARAQTLGLVTERGLKAIEDVVTVGPEAYDTRIRVGVESAAGANGRLTGHVFAFGAYLKRCLFVHLTTEVRSEEDEPTLSGRLALARLRMVGGIKLDALGTMPREQETPP